LESLAFGDDITVGKARKHTLFVANDNDFLGTITDSHHPNGMANPNQFFVFAFDESDLPGYVPQRLHPGICKGDSQGEHGHGKND
jgi:hypothetical protein